MDSHDTDPTQPDPSEQPTEPQPETGPQSPAGGPSGGGGTDPPKRLTRSTDDKMLAGVAGGIGRYFGIDATLVRIGIVALVLFGGAGILLYLAGLVLMPDDKGAGFAAGSGQRPGPLTVIGVVVLVLLLWPVLLGGGFLAAGLAVPLGMLALVGVLVWWLVSGEGPSGGGVDILKRAALGIGVLIVCFVIAVAGGAAAGLGNGTVVAALVILAGVMLAAGAFIGGVRWLILPALSLAIAVGFVSAAGIDLDGGAGEKEYKPTSASAVRDGYRVGLGELVVDLREANLPKGDTRLNLDVGIGAARLIVPEDVCVATSAEIGAGAVDLFNRENGGVDFDWDDQPKAPSGNSRVVVDADIGVGALLVRHDRYDEDEHGPRFGRGFPDDDDRDDEVGNVGCGGSRAAR